MIKMESLEKIIHKLENGRNKKKIEIVNNTPFYLAHLRRYDFQKGMMMLNPDLLEKIANRVFEYLEKNEFQNKEKIIALDVGHGGNSIIARSMPKSYEPNTLDIVYGVSEIYQWTDAPRKVNDYTYIGDFFKLNSSDSELRNKKIDLFVFWGSFIEDHFHYFTPSTINWPLKGLIRHLNHVVKENNEDAKLLIVSSKYAYYVENYDIEKDQYTLKILLKESDFRKAKLFVDKDLNYEIDAILLSYK